MPSGEACPRPKRLAHSGSPPSSVTLPRPEEASPWSRAGSRRTIQDGRASRQAPRRGSEGAPVRHPKGALRVRASRKWDFGAPLYHVPCHSQHRPHPQKGGPSATEREEFLRAAWRLMVAAEVDPERLVFLRTRWEYILRLRPFTVTPRRVSACAFRCRATLRQEHDAFGLDHPRRDGRNDGRGGLQRPGSLRGLRRARPGTHLRSRTGGDHGQPSRPQACPRVREPIEERGCELMYLPAYSPDHRTR